MSQLNNKQAYHKGQTKQSNVGFLSTFVPILAIIILTNDCNLPTTKLANSFDETQRVTTTHKSSTTGKTTQYQMDFLASFRHNIKFILKYCQVSMPRDKFEHLFGFSFVKDMTTHQKFKFLS
jgi:hypothetical protein